MIVGLVFDTKASYTGLHKRVYVLIQKALGKELVWIACSHHVLEKIICDVFHVIFGHTGGPDTALFKRFQKKWFYFDHAVFAAATDDHFEGPKMKDYLSNVMSEYLLREKYCEFVRLVRVFLDGTRPHAFLAPGETHHARRRRFTASRCSCSAINST